MTIDIMADLGPVFLGGRLKRLGEQMQAGAARVIARAGLPVQPTHMPLLAALDREAMAIGQLAEAVGASQPGVTRGVAQLVNLDLVVSQRAADRRERIVSLTPAGEALMDRVRQLVWPPVKAAVDAMTHGIDGPILDSVAAIERALAAEPLDRRVVRTLRDEIELCDFSDALAPEFFAINAVWIEAMFAMEAADREVLENPREVIIDPGGAIIFARSPTLGVFGTCALKKTGEGAFELTKMGVRDEAQGLGAGELLLLAAIDRAQAMGGEKLYLLTNARCATAIHLYEKFGFRHDAGIMQDYGPRYARCDVAMRYVG